MEEDYASSISMIPSYNLYPHDTTFDIKPLEIIVEPIQKYKLRYHSDYEKNPTRRGVIRSNNNPVYRGPTIKFLLPDFTKQYYIRVSLVTIINPETNCRYHHPYELEDLTNDKSNDQQQTNSKDPKNTIIFPIEATDTDGIKSFPNLRIVKLKADELIKYGDLLVFDSPDSLREPQLSSTKETINKFQLNRFHLAFTLGVEDIIHDAQTIVFYARTTAISEEMFVPRKQLTSHGSVIPKSTVCQVYKYAPKHGYADVHNEVLIFFTDKIQENRYGALQITFELDMPGIPWIEQVLDLEVKDQMVSFRTPTFPHPMNNHETVNVVLKQARRNFEPLQFDYISQVICPRCQQNRNKRSISAVYDVQTNDPINRSEDNLDEEAVDYSEILASDPLIFK